MHQKSLESDPQCTHVCHLTEVEGKMQLGGEQKGGKEQELQSELIHLHRETIACLCLVMAKRGVFDIFAENLFKKELEETETNRLICSNGHMTIDLLSPIIWAVLLSVCFVFVAMAFENKSKFVGFTNG